MKPYILLFLSLWFSSCLVVENQFSKIPPGTWRGTLQLTPQEFAPLNAEDKDDKVENRSGEEITPGELPFLFEVKYVTEDSFIIEIINGTERILVSDIQFGRTKARAVDSIRINFPVYDTYIIGSFRERFIIGRWVVNYKENYSIPFKAEFGRNDRFTDLKKPVKYDLTGHWKTIFGTKDSDKSDAIGEFEQNENHLQGTFLTETGDYRFLEGTVQDDRFYLSCFDGAHAFLFEGKFDSEDEIQGSFASGRHYLTTWEATRDENFQLRHPDSLTFVKNTEGTFDFQLPNTKGEMISLNDPKYQGKYKIIQVFGTWCPNCRDETDFLQAYLEENPNENLEVIALAFERYEDQEKCFELIDNFKQKHDVSYEILYAGAPKKENVAKVLPMLNHIMSYPTMIFLDQENNVKKIHTGFAGPATSAYSHFKTDFKNYMEKLLNENVRE